MYLVPLALFFFGKGRGYYVAAAYPMLLAMGAAMGERWLASLPKLGAAHGRSRLLRRPRGLSEPISAPSFFRSRPAAPARLCPQAQRRSARRDSAGTSWSRPSPASAIPCPRTASTPRHHLSATTASKARSRFLGPAYHLPPPISTDQLRMAARLPHSAAHHAHRLGVSREEADQFSPAAAWPATTATPRESSTKKAKYHPDIFVCGPPREPWPVLWSDTKTSAQSKTTPLHPRRIFRAHKVTPALVRLLHVDGRAKPDRPCSLRCGLTAAIISTAIRPRETP